MDKICILLSSYNGEKYIEKQIDTIYAQKNVDVSLLIRDDGSTDDTINIISRLQGKYKNLFLECGTNVGWKRSFMTLLKLVEKYGKFDYYGFSDQDDQWMEDKCIRAIDIISKINVDSKCEPVLYGSNLFITDENKNVKGKLYNSIKDLDSVNTSFCFGGTIYGCTMVWNQPFQDILVKKMPTCNTPHDWWLMFIAKAYGEVALDYDCHIYHIIHGDNAAGIEKNPLKRISKFFRVYFGKDYVKPSVIISELLQLSANETINNRDRFESVANYSKNIRLFLTFIREIIFSEMDFKHKLRLFVFAIARRL